MKRNLKMGPAAMAALALLVTGAYWLGLGAGPRGAEPAKAEAGGKPTHIVAAGRTEPVSEEIDVTTELDGRLARMLVDEGDKVRRGQVMAELVNADYAARVAQARAAVAEREAELERLRNGSRPMQRLEAQAQIREADAVLENARLERDRRTGLLRAGAISRTEFETSDREFKVAEARADAARQRAALVDEETRSEDLQRATAAVERAKGQVTEAEAVLEKTHIRSPIDGVVLRRFRHAGESVSGDGRQPIVTLGNVAKLRVRAEVDENDIGLIHAGQAAYVTATAFGEQRFTGKVSRVGQILGRKKVTTDAPTERIDTKILEALVDLDAGQQLPAGLRVDVYIAR